MPAVRVSELLRFRIGRTFLLAIPGLRLALLLSPLFQLFLLELRLLLRMFLQQLLSLLLMLLLQLLFPRFVLLFFRELLVLEFLLLLNALSLPLLLSVQLLLLLQVLPLEGRVRAAGRRGPGGR
jgi:hypothetical protein